MSRHQDGTPEHQGESLLWTGLWLYAAPCGTESDATLRDMITRGDGALVRYEPLPDEYRNGREVTLDGALGLYRGIASRITRCPDMAAAWEPVVALHMKYLGDHFDYFNEKASSSLPDEFGFVLQGVAWKLGLAAKPSANDVHRVEALVAGWAGVVNATHAAAYRVHLGLIALQTLADLGIDVDWTSYCAATRGVGILTADWQCDRPGLKTWIDEFEYNKYEYRFQRAAWETENPGDIMTPGLDLLVAIRDVYKI